MGKNLGPGPNGGCTGGFTVSDFSGMFTDRFLLFDGEGEGVPVSKTGLVEFDDGGVEEASEASLDIDVA